MVKVGIIGAMPEEIELYLSELADSKKTELSGFIFFSGKINGKDAVVVKSGAGKVNAGMCAQLLVNNFGVSSVIFTGVAGAINPALGISDIVISTDSVQHDLDARGLGFEKGQIPFTDLKFFKASEELRIIACSAAKELGLKAVEGRILTGDQFITNKERSVSLRKEFNGDCVDMEGAAIAHACSLNNTPHLIIRAISDKADHSASVDFKEFCRTASKNSFMLVKEMVSRLEEEPLKTDFIKSKIRTVPDWPKKGVMFRDITTLLKDKEGFERTIKLLVDRYKDKPIDVVAGIESRGFIIGSTLAHRLGVGFVPIRKPGKLPAETISEEYELEYGKDKIEIHRDAVEKGSKVLLVDDLVATGGTCLAACNLIKKLEGEVVECSFVIELPDLKGREKLEKAGQKVFSLVQFEGG